MPRGGHARLTGDESDEKDKIVAGMSYQVRFVGSSDINSADGRGKGCTDEAVREIYSRYNTKNTVKSLTKRQLFVSANCVSIYASTECAVLYRNQTVNITFCNTSEEYKNAFAFVAKDVQSGKYRVYALHCETPMEASDICIAMHEAFTVCSALYQAKRVDRAGWANGLLLSEQKRVEDTMREPEEMHNGEINTNGFHGEADPNNNFGEVSCAVLNGDSWKESTNNSYVNNQDLQARYPEQRLLNGAQSRTPSIQQFAQKDAGFSLAKMLLKGGVNRNRSQSLPFEMPNPWASSNGAGEWGCFQSSAREEEDFDDFSLLARERTSSMNLLTAE